MTVRPVVTAARAWLAWSNGKRSRRRVCQGRECVGWEMSWAARWKWE